MRRYTISCIMKMFVSLRALVYNDHCNHTSSYIMKNKYCHYTSSRIIKMFVVIIHLII